MKTLTMIILLFTSTAHATSELSLNGVSLSSSLEGTNQTTQAKGTINSSDQVSTGLGYKWFLNSRIHLLFGLIQEKYDFKIDDALSSGESTINANEFSVGIRIVASPKVAFSLVSKQKQDIAFKINALGFVELFQEELNILNFQYNQVLMQFRAFNIGFDAFYDFSASGSEIENRIAYGGRVYSVIGRSSHRLRIAAGKSLIEKEIPNLDIKQSTSLASLEYLFRF